MEKLIFVGRQRELEDLGRYIDRSLAGNGQVCFI
jgi:hypothetical protein